MTRTQMTGAILLLTLLSFVLTGIFPPIVASTVAFSSLWLGFLLRKKNFNLHVGFVSLAIILDLLLVLFLQIKRDAVQTALFDLETLMPIVHVLSSTATVFLYFPMAYLGYRQWQNVDRTKTSWHRTLGIGVIILRTVGYTTGFSLVS